LPVRPRGWWFDLLLLAGFVALTVALARGHLLTLHERVADWAVDHRPTPLYWALRVLNYLGQGGQVLMPIALLLAGLQESLDTHIAWVDFTVHKLMPAVLVADWLLDPPRHRLSLKTGLVWLLYPLAYLVYTLIRGDRVGWYPYPFLDPATGGYGRVGITTAAITIGFLFVSAVTLAIGHRRGRSSADRV
jgi:hypothetical protein